MRRKNSSQTFELHIFLGFYFCGIIESSKNLLKPITSSISSISMIIINVHCDEPR